MQWPRARLTACGSVEPVMPTMGIPSRSDANPALAPASDR